MTFMNKYYKRIAVLVITIGIILRMIYISYTSIEERQHDMEGNFSHISYIETIYKTGKLPTSNRGQFYHPPLHYIIEAGFLKIQNVIGIDDLQARENTQILTAIYSSIILIVIYLILKKINIKNIYRVLILAVMAVHPTFIILAGSINNDILSIMFEFLIILYLLKWHKDDSIKNTFLLGIFTAMALLTKVSTIIMGLPIAIVFIDKFITEICINKKQNKAKSETLALIKKYLIKFAIFGLISIGIGFAYIIRNMILFDQSPVYVLKVVDLYYCGDESFIRRFTLFSTEWMKNTYCNSLRECNMFAWIIKCSVFGEYVDTTGNYMLLAQILKWINAILIFVSMFALIKITNKLFIKREKDDDSSSIEILLFTYFTIIVAYIYMETYQCHMGVLWILDI